MEPRINIKILIKKVNQTLNELVKLNQEIRPDISIGKSASLKRSISFKKHKLRSYLCKIKDIGKGNIIEVKYQLDNDTNTYLSTFTNVRKEDLIMILKFRYQMQNREIKILEIKDIPTPRNKVIL